MKRWLAALCLCLCAPIAGFADEAHWVGTWGASPLPPSPAMGPFPATPTFNDQTIRQVVRLSAGGQRLRVRLTNEFGTAPLTIGAATIAPAAGDGTPDVKHQVALKFDGKTSAVIPPGAPLVSDPVALTTHDLDTLSISLYVKGDAGPCTCHATGMQSAFVSDIGDFTKTEFAPKQTIQSRAFIAGVDVETTAPVKTIVVLGDSISDGVGSTLNANRRWPDRLAERLAARSDGTAWGIVNEGISGNRILDNGAGQSALARFDRDVLAVPNVAYVILFEGINDIGLAYGHLQGPIASAMPVGRKITADDLIAGDQQLIARAHAKGIKVIGATIAPYKGAAYFAPEGEKVREAVNKWIRTSHAFDAVLDFDAALRDPKAPEQIAEPLQAGDHLHGSDAGYKKIADSIDLSIFK